MIRQWFSDSWSATKKMHGSQGAAVNSQNWQLMTSGRSQVLATSNFIDWHTTVGDIPWSSVPKTTMDCHSKLVLHLLRNNQPVQVTVHQPRQTTLIFPGPSDQMCCSILNVPQIVHDLLWCERQQRVTVVNARCDKLNVQQATNTSQLLKPKETCLADIWNMSVKTEVHHNSHTKKSNFITRFYHIINKLEEGSQHSEERLMFSAASVCLFVVFLRKFLISDVI